MRQRTISDFFWRDPDISDLSQEDKATLLYFLTSPSSNIIGCYQVVWMIAAAEMGWTKDQLLVVVKRLRAKDLIDFNDAGWVWVKIWWKHNSPGVALSIKSKLIQHAKKQCASIPSVWVDSFGKSLEKVGVDTLAMGYPYLKDAPSDAPYHPASDAACDAPSHAASEKLKSPSEQGLDAPHDAPSDAPYHGGRGNRYLVSNNTTTTNSSSNEKPVVLNDLIYPPGITPDQQEAILSMLTRSGVAQNQWQALLDELHGAQLHGKKTANPISNPAGYVRGIAQRAVGGSFSPERGVPVANQRELQKTLQRSDALACQAALPEHHAAGAQLEHLPERLRVPLSRILAKQTKEVTSA